MGEYDIPTYINTYPYVSTYSQTKSVMHLIKFDRCAIKTIM